MTAQALAGQARALRWRMVQVFNYGFSSAVSGFSGAYARMRACIGSIMSMHQGPSLQIVPAETVRAKGFVHVTTHLRADRQTHARPQSTSVQNSTPQAAAR